MLAGPSRPLAIPSCANTRHQDSLSVGCQVSGFVVKHKKQQVPPGLTLMIMSSPRSCASCSASPGAEENGRNQQLGQVWLAASCSAPLTCMAANVPACCLHMYNQPHASIIHPASQPPCYVPADCSSRFHVACTQSNSRLPHGVRTASASRSVSACATPAQGNSSKLLVTRLNTLRHGEAAWYPSTHSHHTCFQVQQRWLGCEVSSRDAPPA